MINLESSEVERKPRVVLYEELAEYYYKTVSYNRLKKTSFILEVNYHLKNLTLLSLYFDRIVITSATLFNVRDKYIERIINAVLSSKRTREMLDLQVLQIVGWGGETPSEMFDAASAYALYDLEISKNKTNIKNLRSVFEDGYVLSRSEKMPDRDLSKKYLQRLENSLYTSNEKDFSKIVDATNKQYQKTGSLIAIEMIPSLEKSMVSDDLVYASKMELFGTTLEHMKSEMPSLWVYSPFFSAKYYSETATLSVESPKAFLLSPIIFGSFLFEKIDGETFHAIMRQDFLKLNSIKNGDWGRFVEAYHSAISEISRSLSLETHILSENFISYKENEWANRILYIIENRGNAMEINTFIESLGSLSSMILSVSFIDPLIKLVKAIMGRKFENLANDFRSKKHRAMSPFIQKLERAYLN